MGDIPFKNNLKAIDLLSVAGIAQVGRFLQFISGDSQITQDLGIHVKHLSHLMVVFHGHFLHSTKLQGVMVSEHYLLLKGTQQMNG